MNLPAALQPALWLDATSARTAAQSRPAAQETGTEFRKQLCCRSCGRFITDESQRIAVEGDHAHTRSNPHGVIFNFGCFAEAPGCKTLGRATPEHTWFSGCAWRIAACGGCGGHLGWLFSGAARFYGLILERLIAQAGRTA
ncbi:MAG: hypothetical protein HYY48_03090 [Gammaproteobacteria bacterium]|nr:hypothetical protein [Gammaproteobacteria bacterium]